MEQRLAQAIANPGICKLACETVRLALVALANLRKIDETLYDRYITSRATNQEPAEVAQGLRTVWVNTFDSVRPLVAHCRRITASCQQEAGAGPDLDFSDDLDFGEGDRTEVQEFEIEARISVS